jgi:hypothetical protein
VKRSILVNRFGLIVLLSLGLFTSAAFAGNNPGSTPVVVTNTAATPVPVTVQKTELYQASQTVNCTNRPQAPFAFSVPGGKTLVVRHVNVFAGSLNATDTFGVAMFPDDASTSYLALPFQQMGGQIGGYLVTWAANQQVQISATQVFQGIVSRQSTNNAPSCSVVVTISGELI